MLILNAGADRQVLPCEGVIKHAEQIVLPLPDNGMRPGKNFQRPLLELPRPHRPVAGATGKPRLRVKGTPFSRSQGAALKGDPRKAVACDFEGHLAVGAVDEIRGFCRDHRSQTHGGQP